MLPDQRDRWALPVLMALMAPQALMALLALLALLALPALLDHRESRIHLLPNQSLV
jgi:hypothetical protein